MDKNSTEALELYFKNAKYKKEIKDITDQFEELKVDVNKFENISSKELLSLEKKVIQSHVIEEKSLKKISIETGYSYSYVRKLYVDAREKMRIIMSMTIEK